MAKLAVVILNYNGRHFLEKYLPGIVAHSSDFAIVVADNASEDDSIRYLSEYFPQISIIRHNKNHGFAGGYNEALKHLEAEYYVLLNSDVEVSPNWIEPILDWMEQDQSIAACQPKIRSYLEKRDFEYAGAAGGYIDYLGYPFCRGRIFDQIESDQGQYDDIKEIFWATGACMFVRASDFHSVGGFDATFFAHMEEIDLCWRFKLAGKKIFYHPQSIVFHLGGGTLHKSNPRKTFLNYRNGLLMLYKNLPDETLLKTLFTRLVLDGISGIKFITEGKISDCIAIIKAHFDFYSKIRKIKREKNSQMTQIYPGSIVFEYFIKKNTNNIKAFFSQDYNEKNT